VIRIPVLGVVIDDDLEPDALDVDQDAVHKSREPLCRTAAEDPSILRLISVTIPVIPDLRPLLRKVVQHQPRLRIKTQRAVLWRNASTSWEHDIAAFRVRAEDEAAGTFGRLAEREGDGLGWSVGGEGGETGGEVCAFLCGGGGKVSVLELVGGFVCDCATRRWDQPGDDVVLGIHDERDVEPKEKEGVYVMKEIKRRAMVNNVLKTVCCKGVVFKERMRDESPLAETRSTGTNGVD
jgi:hypothetical protein